MGILYPGRGRTGNRASCIQLILHLVDNTNRAKRVDQLASDIAQLQTQVKEAVEDARTQDSRAIVILDKIAKQRGYKTLDEYIADAEKQLSEEDRKKYQEMRETLADKDEAIDISMKVATGLAGIGFTVGLSGQCGPYGAGPLINVPVRCHRGRPVPT